MNNLISIIIPVYNVEAYLAECLNSILKQEYTNIEIIAVDDGSTDSSSNILQKYAKQDKRITVLRKPNGGIASARNYSLRYAKGNYIFFVDSDDLIAPNAIQTLVSIAEMHKADIVSFGFKKFYKDTDIQKISSLNTKPARMIDRQEMFRICFDENFKTKCSNGAYTWARLFKKNVLNDLTFDVKREFYEDEDFASKLIASLSEAHRIVLFDIPLYYYRQRKSSLVHSKRSKRLFALYACRSTMLKRFSKNSIEFNILNKARLTTLIKIMQVSLVANSSGGYALFKKILYSRRDLSVKTKLPYLLGRSIAKRYSERRLEKAKQKNLNLQYWD